MSPQARSSLISGSANFREILTPRLAIRYPSIVVVDYPVLSFIPLSPGRGEKIARDFRLLFTVARHKWTCTAVAAAATSQIKMDIRKHPARRCAILSIIPADPDMIDYDKLFSMSLARADVIVVSPTVIHPSSALPSGRRSGGTEFHGDGFYGVR